MNWLDNSTEGTARTYSQWSTGGSGNSGDPDWVKVHFGALGTATDGIVYRCSSQWPPTTADCGAEGQPDCWGAVQGYAPGTPKQGWMQPDEMFFANGSGLCDHSLIGGTDYTCTSSGRHQLTSTSWESWALDNQRYGISGKEPINWYTTLGSHESFNTRADTYTFPNHSYSISDQLTAGARYIDLRARWICCAPYYEKLSHTTGNDSTGGAAPGDRPYTYAIEEIATWLRNNPTQVIRLDIGVGTGGAAAPDQSYLYDPVDKYLNTSVLTPSQWCDYLHTQFPSASRPYAGGGISEASCADIGASGTYIPYRWPTTDEMHALGRQVIITTNGGALGEDYAFDNLTSSGNDMDSSAGYSNGFSKNFASTAAISAADTSDSASCTRNGVSILYNSNATTKQRDFYNRVWTTEEEARVFGEADFAASAWTGYLVANIADVASLKSKYTFYGSDQATSVEAVTCCNVSLIKLDEFGADNQFRSEINTTKGLADRRDGAIWSWANGDSGAGGDCAVLGGADNTWHSRPCTEVYHFACALPRDGDPTTWPDVLQEHRRITQGTGVWYQGEQLCRQEFGSTAISIGRHTYTGLAFSSPRNGRADQELLVERNAEGRAGDLWLAYSNSGGAWHAGASPVLEVTATANGQPYSFGSWTNHDVRVSASAVNWANLTTAIATITCCKTGVETRCGSLGTDGTITISQEGTTSFAAQATDTEGNTTPLSRFVVKVDKTSPVSAAQLAGPRYPENAPQTFVTSATGFDLSAQDDQSGIAGIDYRFYPTNGSSRDFSTSAGNTVSFTLSGADGVYTVQYRATDNAGNDEGQPHVLPVSLDNTAPIVSVAQPVLGTYIHSATLTLKYVVNDGSGSGVRGSTPLIDGIALPGGHGLASGRHINLLTELALGRHTFTIKQATDNLGNSRTVSVQFTIIATGSSVVADVAQFVRSGAISSATWGNRIAAQLKEVARARTAGQCSATTDAYRLVAREVAADAGGWITSAAGTILNTDMQYVIAHCS